MVFLATVKWWLNTIDTKRKMLAVGLTVNIPVQQSLHIRPAVAPSDPARHTWHRWELMISENSGVYHEQSLLNPWKNHHYEALLWMFSENHQKKHHDNDEPAWSLMKRHVPIQLPSFHINLDVQPSARNHPPSWSIADTSNDLQVMVMSLLISWGHMEVPPIGHGRPKLGLHTHTFQSSSISSVLQRVVPAAWLGFGVVVPPTCCGKILSMSSNTGYSILCVDMHVKGRSNECIVGSFYPLLQTITRHNGLRKAALHGCPMGGRWRLSRSRRSTKEATSRPAEPVPLPWGTLEVINDGDQHWESMVVNGLLRWWINSCCKWIIVTNNLWFDNGWMVC